MQGNRDYRGKQAQMLRLGELTNKYVIAHGSVRSGKTESALAGFIHWSMGTGETYLISEKTVAQLDNVIVPNIRWMSGGSYRRRDKELYAFGSKYLLYSANDEGAQEKIRGLTLGGAFLDETTTQPESFVDEVIGRCSRPRAKIVMCTNPAGSRHWLKRRFIDDEENFSLQFGLEDNPTLTVDYKRDLRRRWTGAYLRRMYFGEWVDVAGQVYPTYSIGTAPPTEDIHERYLAIDVARSGVTHALLIGSYVTPEQDWVLAEWRHDGRNEGVLTPDEQATRIANRLVGNSAIAGVFYDPSAPDFGVALARVIDAPVYAGLNDVIPGIQATASGLESGQLRIDHACPYLLDEFSGYVWDEKAAGKGEDRPMKRDDHGMDALRYYAFTMANMHRAVEGVEYVG